MSFDGHTISRLLHGTSRSPVYLAQDEQTQTSVLLKVPAVDVRQDMAYFERFPMKEWIFDNPTPNVETIRDIVEQIAKGLIAFHRLEMLHQDLRPENIMTERSGTAKIIDFGSARVAGIEKISTEVHQPNLKYITVVQEEREPRRDGRDLQEGCPSRSFAAVHRAVRVRLRSATPRLEVSVANRSPSLERNPAKF